MYTSLKKVAKLFIPKSFLQKNELLFRRLISFKYKGDAYQCNICNFKLKHFVTLNDKDLLCPNCGSRSRTRRLYKILIDEEVLKGTILHFSPPKSLSKKFKLLQNVNYYSSDFENEFRADYNFNITAIDCDSHFFDIIICYHVLEHIDEDLKAMSELYRVLKPNGICYIQTPFKSGLIYEDSKIISEKEREIAFGQKDHVRVYSVEGLQNRLESVGFKVKIKTFDKSDSDNFGFKAETVFLLEK
ncbi:MAG: class I SAM-dependent methyltransferase [Winogradskyella sp.]|uniref:class I SAM-dependent methyltransferase n=1 Tax=Winogradskyella sp. TaxID=1883156 RepID=UPI00385FE965